MKAPAVVNYITVHFHFNGKVLFTCTLRTTQTPGDICFTNGDPRTDMPLWCTKLRKLR